MPSGISEISEFRFVQRSGNQVVVCNKLHRIFLQFYKDLSHFNSLNLNGKSTDYKNAFGDSEIKYFQIRQEPNINNLIHLKMALIKELLGKTPQIGENTFLAETATVIGDVTMGKDCSIWYKSLFRYIINCKSILLFK